MAIIRNKEAGKLEWLPIVGKIISTILGIMIAIIGYFLADKLQQIETELKKIDVVDEKVQRLTKSQIQIMAHLKIPVPNYLFVVEEMHKENQNPLPKPFAPNKDFIKSELNFVQTEKKYRATKHKHTPYF